MQGDTQQAITVFNQGGIVIFPTDTAYGIGCRMDKEKSIKRLFKIRKRPETQATPVLVSGLDMARSYVKTIPQEVVQELVLPYWPGALTIILPALSEKVPNLVRGGTNTLGVRMPNHPTILEMINRVWVPLLGPSANFHGEKTPYAFEELDPQLVRQVDFVVKGECTAKQQSTVIDCSTIPWKIQREGAIKISSDLINKYAGNNL